MAVDASDAKMDGLQREKEALQCQVAYQLIANFCSVTNLR